MLDTLAVAQQLAAGGVDREQAEAIADAIRQGVDQGEQVTSDQFKAGVAELRTEIASLDTRLSAQGAELRTEVASLDTRLSTQGAELRTEIASLDTRLSTQIAELRTELRTEIASLDTRLSTQIAGVRTEIANLETRLVRWMVGTVIATATLTVGILRLLG